MLKGLVTTVQCGALALKTRMSAKVTKKRSGDTQLVVALILVAVAIGLCIVFRDKIGEVMSDLFDKIGEAIDGATGGLGGSGTTDGN